MEMEKYDKRLAAAYVRGAISNDWTGKMPEEIIALGEDAGLKLYPFKEKEPLPRVRAVLGMLKGLQPERLLDVGSGRGVFLFPFLNEFPRTPVTAVDLLPHRVEMLQTLSRGGIENLTALRQDICAWEMEDNAFDVVTLLEVLEHIPNVQSAVANAVRLARRYVVVSVPSKPDNNPEHIHLLTKNRLTELFGNAGCAKLHFSGVNGHLIMLAAIDG